MSIWTFPHFGNSNLCNTIIKLNLLLYILRLVHMQIYDEEHRHWVQHQTPQLPTAGALLFEFQVDRVLGHWRSRQTN